MMLRAWLRRFVILCTSGIAAGCMVSATGTGLTPGFAAVARDAHEYMTSELIPVGRMPQFPDAMAESRAMVEAAEARVANEADRGVWLILTMINAKANETRKIYELQTETGYRADATVEALKNVVGERTQCLGELEGWLTDDQSRVAALNRGTCLQLAKQAAANLTR
jgi:hypothetical protein